MARMQVTALLTVLLPLLFAAQAQGYPPSIEEIRGEDKLPTFGYGEKRAPPDRDGRGTPPPGDHSKPPASAHDIGRTLSLFGILYYADELPDKDEPQPGDHLKHDHIWPLTENASDESRNLAPAIFVADTDSCYPYPAIDFFGRLSGGLKPHGPQDGDCGFDYQHAQMYVRTGRATSTGQAVAMYAIYLPKEQNKGRDHRGHRHSFENVVFFLRNATAPGAVRDVADIEKACFARTFEDRYACTTEPSIATRTTDSVEYKVYSVRYGFNAEADHHDLRPGPVGEIFDDDCFAPLIDWDRIPRLPRAILNADPFDLVTVPFSDTHFQKNIDKAAHAPVWSATNIL